MPPISSRVGTSDLEALGGVSVDQERMALIAAADRPMPTGGMRAISEICAQASMMATNMSQATSSAGLGNVVAGNNAAMPRPAQRISDLNNSGLAGLGGLGALGGYPTGGTSSATASPVAGAGAASGAPAADQPTTGVPSATAAAPTSTSTETAAPAPSAAASEPTATPTATADAAPTSTDAEPTETSTPPTATPHRRLRHRAAAASAAHTDSASSPGTPPPPADAAPTAPTPTPTPTATEAPVEEEAFVGPRAEDAGPAPAPIDFHSVLLGSGTGGPTVLTGGPDAAIAGLGESFSGPVITDH